MRSIVHHPISVPAPRFHSRRAAVVLATGALVASGATIATVALVDDDPAQPAFVEQSSAAPGVRYDGGPEEGSAAIYRSDTRYDGGPDEGTRGPFAGR